MMRIAVGVVVSGVLAMPALAQTPSQPPAAPEGASGRAAARSAVVAERYMAAAANPIAAEVGAAVLADGGTAADSAIAMQLVLGLVEPQSSGIGGGAFMLHFRAADRSLVSYDARETAPRAVDGKLFQTDAGQAMRFYDAVVGGRSVGVPGVPKLIHEVHRAHGKLPLARLFQPAIELAERGFEISPRLAALVAADPYLLRDPEARAYFYRTDFTPKPAGTRLVNPAYADTLRRILADANDFYTGELARAVVTSVTSGRNPGRLSLEDMAAYQVKPRPVVCGPYRAVQVCGMGPPSSGGVAVQQILGILSGFDLRDAGPNTTVSAHLIAEASRLAFADRDTYLADPDFVPQPVAGLLDDGYLITRAQLVNRQRSMGRATAGTPPQRRADLAPGETLEFPSTSHLVAIDQDGNAVSMTTTIEDGFGARRMVRGFLLNNQLTDFSFIDQREGVPVANRVEPGKRPRSSMAPTVLLNTDGTLRGVVGSPGGSRIIGYVAKAIVAMVDWEMDPQAAIELPHILNRNGPTELEKGTPAEALKADLEAMGHQVTVGDLTSGLQAILVAPGRLVGGADPRREGVAVGR
ncbi:MAG: gamma-glutamyltransferase [Alphaproteobacteria bacterium]|nr:gamma-glutamyltransferase [Alphaproteobacteria bacterium]TAD91601.1 MAG: gamma-glutamyltransferase [Alphaproteobacteria bacterium]